MSFTSLWPLFFLLGVPAIIILYILKPRGKDMEISSNLLWKRLFKYRQSRTFFEKFRSEILMALQILTVLLLMFALMAPFVMMNSVNGGSTTVIIDNSLSMRHKNADGQTRLEAAKEEAIDHISSANGDISVISVSDTADILIANSTDRNRIKELIRGVEASDKEGDLSEAYRLASTLESDNVLILTDGAGVAGAEDYAKTLKADVIDVGEEASNVSLDYIYYSEAGGEVSMRFSNYSASDAEFDVTVYDDAGNILGVQSSTAAAGKSSSILFTNIHTDGAYIRGEVSTVRFAAGGQDSLALDNSCVALTQTSGEAKGILIGSGNTFIERAYYAVTGADLTKTMSDSAVSAGNYNVVIYDAGTVPQGAKTGRTGDHEEADSSPNMLRFETSGGAGTLSSVVVDVKESEITEGLSEFSLGSNQVVYYELPAWATSFMEADGKCVAYYGINGNHKEVVVGFDIRETDFPVKAEFPVFIAGAMGYLSDLSILGKNVYEAGETIVINPSAEVTPQQMMVTSLEGDMEPVSAPAVDMGIAGLYRVSAGDRTEYFIIRASLQGRDGRLKSEDIHYGGSYSGTKARRSLRNALIIAALVLLLIEWLIFMRRMNYKGKFYLISRSLLILLAVLSLLGIRLPKRSRDTTTIFLVDLSVSDTQNLKAFDCYINDSLSRMPKHNKYAIVTFGRDAVVEQFVTDQDMYMGFGSKTNTAATDFENGLQRAVSMLPSDTAGRIVVLTDGRETAGNIERTASLFVGDDISLEAILVSSESGNDAYVKNVEMPETLHEGESYYLKVAVESNYDTNATVIITSGGREVAREDVRLQKGSNEFVFQEEVTSKDVESYEVKVEADGDSVEENNNYSAYSRVEDSPRVLVLKGKGENGNAFENLLDAAHVNAEFLRPERAPKELNDLLTYKAVILENVYKDELPEEFLNILETYVKDYGGGFGACGGEDSFMLGGYNDSVIETVLPVNMELRGTLQIPSTAIVMVIDHSGSMLDYAGSGMTNLDVAVEASKRGVDNLRDTDQVGILCFDDTYTWVHHLSEAEDKDGIKNDIESIRDGGGTIILPAIEEARKELAACDAEVKHIILLTDGMGETYDFSSVTDQINIDGITLSTVAVGAYSDTRLMESLAKECNGRYYYADSNTDIPRIFAQEVYLGGDTYIKNGDYTVFPKMPSDLTKDLFPDGWYNVLGYIAASPKTGAQQLLVSGLDDPILTVWQYGLGKTMAWNSDVDGGWSSAYSGDESYAELWKRIVDFIGGTPGIGEDYLDVSNKDGKTVLTYHTSQYGDDTEISGIFTTPDGEGGELDFTSAEPGLYKAELDSVETGLYNINVRRSDNDEVTGAFTTATVVQYSDEYRFDVTEDRFRSFIDQFGQWRELDDNIWKKLDVSRNGSFSLTGPLLVLLIMLFLADVAGRRFGWEPVIRKKAKAKVKAEEPLIADDPQLQAQQAQQVSAEEMKAAEEKRLKKNRQKRMKQEGLDVPDTGTLDTAALLKRKKDRNI